MATIGTQLGEAREKHGITIEDAAHDTRIHPNMILSIEEDDFSMFPSVAYARSFIRNYSEYLDVDLTREMEALDSSVTGRLSENGLMNEMKKTIKKESRFRLKRNPAKKQRRPVEKAGGSPLFLNFLLLLLIGALGLFYFLGYRASTPEEARIEITKGLNRVNIFSDQKPIPEEVIPANPLANSQVEAVDDLPETADETVASASLPTETIGEPVTESSGSDSDSVASASAPVIAKPDVELDLEESPDPTTAASGNNNTVAMSRLRPRGTPQLNFSSGEPVTPSIRSEDMPAVLRTVAEPEAVLRPEGTSPASPNDTDEEERGRSAQADQPALRALPVTR